MFDNASESVFLIPQDIEGLMYQGYIIVKDEEFRINVNLKSSGTLKDASFECDWRMSELLKGYESTLQKKLSQSSTLKEYLLELRTLLENLVAFTNERLLNFDAAQIQEVLKEINKVGWNRLTYTNEDFTRLKFLCRDVAGRKHFIYIENKEGQNGSKISSDLPLNIQQKAGDSISTLYEKFSKTIEDCQSYWNALERLDNVCWVLEPESIIYGCNYRRIALGKNASIRIEINPLHPRTFPECRFLGPTQIIEPLKGNLSRNLGLWNEGADLLENLETVLQIHFPSKVSISKDDTSMACGICYSYRLEDEVPEKSCEDVRCAQIYHISCLVEWMRSLPTCRQSFNVIFGECPYCNKKLTINLKS